MEVPESARNSNLPSEVSSHVVEVGIADIVILQSMAVTLTSK